MSTDVEESSLLEASHALASEDITDREDLVCVVVTHRMCRLVTGV
jgi:hypothetical protein